MEHKIIGEWSVFHVTDTSTSTSARARYSHVHSSMACFPILLLLLGLTESVPTFVDPADVEIDRGLPYGDVFKLSATLQDHMV